VACWRNPGRPEYARRIAAEYIERAKKALYAFPASDARDALMYLPGLRYFQRPVIQNSKFKMQTMFCIWHFAFCITR
jgi:hypothetical protein